MYSPSKSPELIVSTLKSLAQENNPDDIRRILEDPDLPKIDLGEVVSEAISHFAQESLLVLLDFTTREEIVEVNNRDGVTPLVLSLQVGNVDAFSTLTEYFPLEESEVDVAYDLLLNISESNSPYELLKVFVKHYKSFDGEFELGSYCDAKRNWKVSEEEIQLMLLHPRLFEVTEVKNVLNLSPSAAFMLYIHDNKSMEYKSDLLLPIVLNAELLLRALAYLVPDDITEVLSHAFVNDEDSALVIMKKCNPTKEEVYRAVFAVVTHPFLSDCVRYSCNKVGISTEDIEVMVMEQTTKSLEGSVNSLISLGVKLGRSSQSRQLIGEKIAFNCEASVWKELLDNGFKFNRCATDLLIHIVSSSDNIFDLEKLLQYVTNYDNDIPYYRFASDQQVRHYMYALSRGIDNDNTSKFVEYMTHNEIDKVYGTLRRGIVVWKNIVNYDWLDNVTNELARDPFMQEGLYFIWKILENRILRCIDVPPGQLVTNFRHWLMASTEFQQPITVIEDRDSTFVKIGDTSININSRITTSGKYKGLDLFSGQGEPLTTKQEISKRRQQLQMKR